jgi:anti-anti-sigma factor
MSTTFSPVPPLVRHPIDTTSQSPAFIRVAVVGEVDLATAGALRDGLLGVLSTRQPSSVEIDLAKVSFIDCAGLSVLLVTRQAALRAGCQLRITNPQPIVHRVLEVTGLLRVLTATSDLTPMPIRSAPRPRSIPGRRP